jgi:hypothetical protein
MNAAPLPLLGGAAEAARQAALLRIPQAPREPATEPARGAAGAA